MVDATAVVLSLGDLFQMDLLYFVGMLRIAGDTLVRRDSKKFVLWVLAPSLVPSISVQPNSVCKLPFLAIAAVPVRRLSE